MIRSEEWRLRVLVAAGLWIAATSGVFAGSPHDSCTRHTRAGGWGSYSGGSCGSFWMGWGSNGTDRMGWYTSTAGIGRDMYITYRHYYLGRSNGDTAADHWAYSEGGNSHNTRNQQHSGSYAEHTVATRVAYNWDDWLEVGSDGGGGMDTIADRGRFYPELDAVYSSKQVDTSMYAGNVYYWRYTMSNPGQAYWAWTGNDRFGRTGGSISGPGWYSSSRVNNAPGTGPGGSMALWFNMRPTSSEVGSQNVDFQMVRESVSWFGDKVGSNGNMRTAVSVSRKAPGATDGWDTGPKRKGETATFYIKGADSWGTGNNYAWDFDGAYTQGWSAVNACTVTQEDSNNRVRIDITGGDPHLQSSPGLTISAASCTLLTVRMYATGGSTAKLYWANENGGYSEARQASWPIIADSTWRVYSVYLPDGTGWGGTVNRLRLDPVDLGAASGQTVYIDWLRVHHTSNGFTGKFWLKTYGAGTWNILESVDMNWSASDGGRRYYQWNVTGNYPQIYDVRMHTYNDAGAHCDNHDRRYGYESDGGDAKWAMLNSPPGTANTSLLGNAWTNDDTPTLAWSYSDPDSNTQRFYRLQVDNNSNFASPEVDTKFAASSSNSFTPEVAIAEGQQYYRTSTIDGFGSALDGTYVGATLGQEGAVPGDTAISLNGTVGSYVALNPVNDYFPLHEISAEFWIKTSETNLAGIVSYASTASDNDFLIYNANNLSVYRGPAVSSGINLADGQWHHVVVTWRSLDGQVLVYDNGSLAFTGEIPRSKGKSITANGALLLGQEQDSVGGGLDGLQALNGLLDEVAIYDRVIAAAEVTAHYNARNTANDGYALAVLDSDPYLYYRLGESSGAIGEYQPHGPLSSTAQNLGGGWSGWSTNTSFRVDVTPPTVSTINRQDPVGQHTNGNEVTWRVTFSENVNGVDINDFTLVDLQDTVTGESITGVTPISAASYYVTCSTGTTGDGDLRLDLLYPGATVTDDATNELVQGFTTGQIYTIDRTPPTCAISRYQPSASSTNATTVRFEIAFSESVTGFTIDDIQLTLDPGILAGELGNFEGPSGASTYYVRVNNISGTGFVSINFDAAAAQDLAANPSLAPDPVQNYFVDQGAFSCSITRTDDNPTNADTVGYRLEFNKEPAAFVQGHITLGGSIIGTSLANFAVDPEDAKVYTVDVTDISGTGTVSIAIAADTVYDFPGNGNTAAGPVVYDIDQGAITGTITRTATSPTNADTVGYQIALNKEPIDFDVDDLQLGGTVGGTSLDNFTYVGEVEGEFVFTVDVIDINGTGTVSLALPADTIHDEASNTNNEIPAVAYTIDQTPPTVQTINRHTPATQVTNAAQVVWRVTFSELAANVDINDFTLVDITNSIIGEEILSVSNSTGQVIDVTVSTGTSGNGDLRLDVILPGATIDDARGNPMELGFITGQVYTLDRSAPIIESIVRLDPTGQYTNASEVTWQVTFSRNVNNVDTDDFTLNTTGTLAGVEVTEVSAASGTTIDVTASTGTGNGQLRLYVLVPPATITDDVGNTLATDFTTGQLYVLDRTALTCQINRTSPNPNNAVSVGYQVVFNKDVSDFTLDDVTLGGTVPNTLLSSFSGGGTVYTFNVTNIQESGTVTVELAVGVAHDISGNPNTGCGPVEYTIDKEALFCSIFRLSGNPTNADTVSFQINFNKSVSDFAVGDITLGGLAGTSLDNFSGSGSSYTVDVVDIAGSGQVSIELAAGVAHDAASNPNTGCGPIAYTIDHTGPTCNIIRSSANPNSSSTVGYQVSFNEPVTGFTVNDLVLGGSIEDTELADFVPVSSTVYTVNVVNIVGNGTVSLEVPADVADDALGNPNTGCGPLAYTIDQEEVLVTVNQQFEQEDPTPWLPILFDVEFSKPVIGFAVGDVVFTGTASGISYSIAGSGASYTIEVNGVSVPGTVQPTLPADVARDAAFNWNTASTSDDNTVTYDPAPTPTITGWRSVRTHGGQGPLSIALNPSAVVTEPRRNSVQRLEIDFDQAVQPENGSLDLTDVSIQDTQSNGYQATTLQLVNNGLRLVVQFSPGLLPSGKRYTIDLGDNFKGTSPPYPLVGGTRSCQVRVLEGDANGDSTVNVQDLVIIKNANRDPAAEENCHLDVSADGEVNIIDLAITNSCLGQSAP